MSSVRQDLRTAGNGVPQPVRNGEGATILGPRNVPLELENPSLLVIIAAFRLLRHQH